MISYANKVGIITGGNGRLGRTFAEALAKQSNVIYLFDIAGKCDFETNNIIYKKVNITNEKDVFENVNKIYESHGKLDFLINNAALQITNNFEKMKIEDFRESIDVNLTASYICIKAVSKYMMESSYGNIVNIGSMYGVVSADPHIYGTSGLNSPDAYAASKAGLIHLTKYLAVNLAKYNIRVNSISPSGVFNHQPQEFLDKYLPKVPMGRMMNREELIGPLNFLLSDESSYITGHNLVVDGGFTII
jgi:NAD(P)-dependent dehydrogenase (short-subunit alcohol dehydrogenase family)